MDEFTTLRQVRQIAQFPLQASLFGGELALLQKGLGGPYISISAADLVGWGLASGGTLRLSAGEAISWNGTLAAPVTLRAGPLGFSLSAPVAVSGNLDAVGLSVAGQPVATHNEVQQSFNYLLANSVASWNGRTGAVELLVEDILRAGGAPADNPVFSGRVVGPTHWNPALCDDTLVTSAWVQSALCAGLNGFAASPYFYGSPAAATPPAGDYSKRIANTMWVTDEVYTLLNSPEFAAAVAAGASGVTSFNARTGAVVLTTADVTGAGGALLASPVFTGVPAAPTAAVGTSSTQLATTAFVAGAFAAGAGMAINVNSLTTIPLAGDGVTDNYAAWQQISTNMANLNNGWPITVTLTDGAPCVVNLTAHGLKPNQAFRFTTSGSPASGITPGTIYYVTAANIAANTFTFSATANPIVVLGQAEGTPVATAGTSSGTIQIVLLSREWINLFIPPGTYATHLPFGSASNRTTIELYPMGLSKVRLSAYGVIFDDLINPSPTGASPGHMSLPGPAPGGWLNQWYDFVIMQTSAQQGANSTLTLRTITNSSKYYVGQWIAIFGLDLQGQFGKFTSGPANNHFFEFNQISAINYGTGVISLRIPPRFIDSGAFPNMFNGPPGTGSGVVGGGPTLIAPMNPAWDMELELIGARFPITTASVGGRRQTFIDCTWDGVWNPHIGRHIAFRNCRMVNASNQIDKMIEYLEFTHCDLYLPFSSTSVTSCVVKGCTGSIVNTPRNILIDDSIMDNITVGTQVLGTTDNILIRNTRATFFLWAGRSDRPGQGPGTGGNAILANWTFSNGTFSRDLSLVPQQFSYQPWAIPGAKCFLSDEGAVYNNMGAPFVILNTYMTGTAVFNPSIGNAGTGGTPGAVVLTVVGGTGTAATLNATISASGSLTGAITVASGGNYTAFPAQPAAVTGGGLTGATVMFNPGSTFNFDTTLKAIPTLQSSSAVTVTIASPAVFTGPALANGTQVLLQTTGALPAGFVANTTVYWVVNTSGSTFQLSATSGGAAINSSGTQSGTHTAVANPLHINIHPCPRFTGVGNTGSPGITDLNGAIDEPIYSRCKRSFAGRQQSSFAFQIPLSRIWGTLVSMTVNVIQAGTVGTVTITCPGFTQPNLGSSPFSQVVNLTVAGVRTVTPSGVTGAQTGDTLVTYGDWLSGGGAASSNFLIIAPSGWGATPLSNCPIFTVEFVTDQGITKYPVVIGADTRSSTGSAIRVDTSFQQFWPAVA